MLKKVAYLSLIALILAACSRQSATETSTLKAFDLMIVNGLVYDGYGGEPINADIAIDGDRIVAIGSDLGSATETIDAEGLAVAPGFINMLSWATESLLEDGNSQSDIRQGVTLEVMGEGMSMGPLNETMIAGTVEQQGDIKFDVTWTTLGEYLQHLEDRGIATNVASFVGATTVRIHELGFEDRAPTEAELERMQGLVRAGTRIGTNLRPGVLCRQRRIDRAE